jgi:hypothetical protein
MDIERLIPKALTAKRENRSIEFKESFDINFQRDWCEIIKDIIAIANTDGGVILIGINNKGQAVKSSVKPILQIDHADLVSKIHKYTNVHFSDIEITEEKKSGRKIAAFRIKPSPFPIAFSKPGTYDIGGGKQGRAFSEGTVYFRHGAKSEPGTTDDLRKAIEKRIASVRKEMIKGVRRVVAAPTDSTVVVMPKEVVESKAASATPIRIVDDPSAPAYRKVDPDKTHPYRLKEFVKLVQNTFGEKVSLSSYDILCLRRLYDLDSNQEFCHKPLYTSLQYSDALLQWLKAQYAKDPEFFSKSRKQCYDRRYELHLVGPHKAKKK